MARHLFSEIINAINEGIVYQSTQKEYFNPWKHGEDSSKVFQRKTKLPLSVVFWLIVSRIVQSLPVVLSSFFEQMRLPIPGKSAFSMKRALIKSVFFEDINSRLVSKYYENRTGLKRWNGYVVLACDGSRIALPDVAELGETYGYYNLMGHRLYPCAKAAIFQDTLNNITVMARLVDRDVDERYTFMDCFSMANRLAGGKTIMTLDRGYFSYLMMFLMIKEGQAFVMKSCKAPWRKAFIESGKKEDTVTIVPTRGSSINANPQWRLQADKTISVRLVRFDHPDGSADVLITNLMDSKMFDAQQIIEIYRLRWSAETAYGVYKNDMALELFSSFRKDGVLQDFHAAIILYNLASIFAADCNRSSSNRKPDMNVAVGMIHNLCPALAANPPAKKLIIRIRNGMDYLCHYLTYIVPGRSFKRTRKLRKTSGKFFRNTNFAIAV